MQIENVPIHKGPDKWLLAESLFHDDEFPEDAVKVKFRVKKDGKEFFLSVRVSSIQKITDEEGTYLISGVCSVRKAERAEIVLNHVPVKLGYSVKTRTGIANVNF